MASLQDVRTAALALPEVMEGHGPRGVSWSLAGDRRPFAWERPFSKADVKRFGDAPVPVAPILALRTADLAEKEALIEAHAPVFTITHFDGYAAVLVRVADCGEELLAELLLDAWLVFAPEELARRHLAQRGG